MANSAHVEWLLEGTDSWNTRRQHHDFEPDLVDANIYEAFRRAGILDEYGQIPLSGIDFTRTDLRRATFHGPFQDGRADLRRGRFQLAEMREVRLANCLLDGADLSGVPLQKADLRKASLRGAKLRHARLIEANLCEADLTDADLESSDLRKANISIATLVGAILVEAKLWGANLGMSQPWEATLFKQQVSRSESEGEPAPTRHVRCVADLLEGCKALNNPHADHVLYFRGERKNVWELCPSVMRQSDNSHLRERESDMLRDLISRRPGDFAGASSALAEWVLARHHELHTRLLDVTRNPLVALFWASHTGGKKPGILHTFSVPRSMVKPFNSDAISVVANFAKLPRAEYQDLLLGRQLPLDFPVSRNYKDAMTRLYELIRQEKPYFTERIKPQDFFRVYVVEPQQSFERIRVQSGAFLISAFHEQFERSKILDINSGIPTYDHYAWEVPSDSKKKIQDELRLLNITQETLLPSLDETARAVNNFYS